MDHLIEALRWDPANHRALVMMGNLWAQVKQEPHTAIIYYREALKHQPNDHIGATNLGAMLLREGRTEEAVEVLQQAARTDPTYPNTHLALAQVFQDQDHAREAFEEAVLAIRYAPVGSPVQRAALEHAGYNAHRCAEEGYGSKMVKEAADHLAKRAGRPVEFREDAELPTAARLEVAENHGRNEHVVAYRPGLPAMDHLILHELHHLAMILDAREQGANERFITTEEHRRAFRTFAARTVAGLAERGIARDAADHYLDAIFRGLMLQAYNAPLDLFIEYDIHQVFEPMRPHQFLSLGRLVEEAVKAGTDPEATALAGDRVARPNRIYTATLAMLYQELYGVDHLSALRLSPQDRKLAEAFYTEFKEYRDDREPGEEYEVVAHWAKDLGLDGLYRLEPETPKADDPLTRDLNNIEADPIGSYEADPDKVAEMRTFQERAKEQGLNMAVVLFMVDALKFFKHKDKATIQKAAFEIAMVGTQGIHPEKQGYKLASVPGVTFSGFHLLAYYYVSFKLVLPELLPELQLPYDAEYAMAEQIYTATP